MLNEKYINIKVPKDLYEQLKAVAESKNISLASLIRIIATEYVKAGK